MNKSAHVALLAASLIASMTAPRGTNSKFDYVEVAIPEYVAGNICNVVGAVIVNMGFSAGVDVTLMADGQGLEVRERSLAPPISPCKINKV